MKDQNIGIVVLAAGKGTRMKSSLPKVLQPVLEEPLLYYPLKACVDCGLENMAVVSGFGAEKVSSYLEEKWPDAEMILQEPQLGTGHAVQSAWKWIERFDTVVVIPGDAPLVLPQTIDHLVSGHLSNSRDATFIAFAPPDPSGYGRVVESESGVKIVEEKDATGEQKRIRWVNSGFYVFRSSSLLGSLDELDCRNAQNEFYLTDIIPVIAQNGGSTGFIRCENAVEMEGVNTPAHLESATGVLRNRIIKRHMDAGVKCMDASTVWVGPEVVMGEDVWLEPFVQIWGSSNIGPGSRMGSFSVVRNTRIGHNVHLSGHVMISDSILHDEVKVGPFAVMRNGAEAMDGSFAGKFVEVKKSVIGEGSKVPHLAYIGDATIGRESNIGAGCITCNYDGVKKNPTRIGDRCFVGSDTMLVAPVTLEDDAYTAAGSVITKDVSEGSLAIGRARQKTLEGWVHKRRDKMRMESGEGGR